MFRQYREYQFDTIDKTDEDVDKLEELFNKSGFKWQCEDDKE